jgi:hypothetical protein
MAWLAVTKGCSWGDGLLFQDMLGGMSLPGFGPVAITAWMSTWVADDVNNLNSFRARWGYQDIPPNSGR